MSTLLKWFIFLVFQVYTTEWNNRMPALWRHCNSSSSLFCQMKAYDRAQYEVFVMQTNRRKRKKNDKQTLKTFFQFIFNTRNNWCTHLHDIQLHSDCFVFMFVCSFFISFKYEPVHHRRLKVWCRLTCMGYVMPSTQAPNAFSPHHINCINWQRI